MAGRASVTCDECASTYYADSSAMSALCPECAHVLYGYPNCEHRFRASGATRRCEQCGWDGSRSSYVRGLLAPERRRGALPLDLRGLTLVISDKPDIERDAVAAAWTNARGDVLRLGRFWEPPALDPTTTCLYGAETFCQVLAQKLGLSLISPDDDLLLKLPKAVTRRKLERYRLDEIDRATFPAFVKSMVPKLMRSRVYSSAQEVAAESRGLDAESELLVAEVVELQAEVRSWVLDGEVLTLAWYEGTGVGDLDAARELIVTAAASPAVPATCVIDVGLTPDRGWIVIEVNAAWGAGLNGCDPVAAARCIANATNAATETVMAPG